MKKLILIVTILVGFALPTYAQDSIVLYITDSPEKQWLCIDNQQRVIVYGEEGCETLPWFRWMVQGQVIYDVNPLVIEPQLGSRRIIYESTTFYHTFYIEYCESRFPSSFTRDTWKHLAEADTIEAVGQDSIELYYDYLWSTGETTRTIEVTEPGSYTCEISDWACGSATRTFIVKDNVEASLATTDLATNLNMVTWQTTEAQAEYVSQVKVYRDGALVGTAPYTDGVFIDNIGSEAASRTYTVLAVAPDGTDCPILSHPKETIHMTYTLGVGNTIVIGWNHPTGYDLVGYNICEWNPNAKDGGLTVIDYVGAGVSSYTCSESQFDHGMIVVQGVERTKAAESRLLSNRSLDYVGIGEKENKFFNLYPNPTTGRVTIEGTGRLTITNTLGQTLLTRDITDTETIDLPMGVWFVKLDGATRKVVVE